VSVIEISEISFGINTYIYIRTRWARKLGHFVSS